MNDTHHHILKCPQCGFDNPTGFKFCGNCAAPLKSLDATKTRTFMESAPRTLKDRMQAEASKIKGERRRVVVMFADISGFTDLSRHRDPEELKKIVDGAFAELTDVVYQYEGYIDKVIGDSLMVLFGAPIAHEDDSERAVLCALSLLKTINTYSMNKDVKLDLSIGISRGLCYAGEYGRPGDYTVIGKDVNLAERLEKLAPAGSVYCSKGVFDLTSKLIEYHQVGEHDLKGIGTQQVYQALSPNPATKEGRPFVGRQIQLGKLEQLLDDTIRGKGNVCFITGERGIGKTRMYGRFKWTRLDDTPILVGQARGISYLKNEFYYVLRGILRSILGIGEELEPLEASGKIRDFFSSRDQLLFAIPFIKYLISLPMSPEERSAVEAIDPAKREGTINAIITRFFTELADERPIVMVVEDAHRMDGSSRGFFAELSRHVRSSSILILMLCWEVLEGFGSDNPHILMPALTLTEVNELMALSFDGKPPSSSLLGTVFNMTKGNPLYTEEIIHMFKQGDMVKQGEVVDLASEKIQIPDRIYNIVLARIDKLEPEVKDVLKKVSVIGFEFTDIMLSKIEEKPVLVLSIDRIENKDFVRLIGETSYLDEKARVYIFKNEMIKDVAYELILKDERRALHRKVAEVMEKLYADNIDNHTDELAYHFQEAHDPRAAPYLLKSGERKYRGYRLDEAAADLQNYLAIKQDAKAYLLMGQIHRSKNDFSKAAQFFQRAETLAEDDNTKGVIKTQQGGLLATQGNFDEGLDVMKQGYVLISEVKHKIRNLNTTGHVYYNKGDYDNAEDAHRRAIELGEAELGHDTLAVAKSYEGLANVLTEKGQYPQALEYYAESLKTCVSLFGESHPSVAGIHLMTGGALGRMREFDKSLPHFTKSLEIFTRVIGERSLEVANSLNNIGIVYTHKGDHQSALEYMEKALTIKKDIYGDVHPEVASSTLNVGMVNMSLMNFGKAMEYLARAADMFISIFGEKHNSVAVAYKGIGDLHAHRSDYRSALEYYQKCRGVWLEVFGEGHPYQAMAQSSIGRMHADLGEYMQALECFKKALVIRERVFGGDRPDIASTHFDLADVSYHTGDYQRALEHGQIAYDMLSRLHGETDPDVVSAGVSLGEIYTIAGDTEKAVSFFAKARAVYESNPDAKVESNVAARLIKMYTVEDSYERAKGVLSAEQSRSQESDNRHSEAETWILAAELELARGNGEVAVEYVNKALALIEGLGLKPVVIDALRVKGMASGDAQHLDRALALAREIGDKPREAEVVKKIN